jgi:tRNA(Arg) A34 adenosine deaminase TadA
MLDDHALLSRVFALADQARAAGDHPFGALLAVDGVVVAEVKNRVNTDRDITAHAELTLVRQLERDGNLELLGRGVVFASCEPCPMCVGAMFWAGARSVVYGLSAERLTELATEDGDEPIGFSITASEIGLSASPAMLFTGPLREAEAELPHLDYWQ